MEASAEYARPRVIRGTRAKPLPLLPSGPGGVHSRPLHEARSLTTTHANMRPVISPAAQIQAKPALTCTSVGSSCLAYHAWTAAAASLRGIIGQAVLLANSPRSASPSGQSW